MRELEQFDSKIVAELTKFISQVKNDDYVAAMELILHSQANGGRLHVTGIGKPGHVANYAASLFSSTGTPCYFLHGTEAVHGSCGQLREGDVVIIISNSGETAEMIATAHAIIANGCKIIAVTGNADSTIAKMGDIHLLAAVQEEGDTLNRAPRASILVQTLALQRLSILLQEKCDLTPQKYVKWHPGGSLGVLRKEEK